MQELEAPKFVRRLKNDDLRNAKKHMTGADAQKFNATIALMQALRKPGDSIALTRAADALKKADELQKLQR